VVGEQAHDGYQRVSGVVHVHTTLSDGAATPDEVIAAARAAGLKFVVITDHNNLDAKKWEGYHDGVLVIVGTEVSTTAGHVLGLGIEDPVFRFSGDARDGVGHHLCHLRLLDQPPERCRHPMVGERGDERQHRGKLVGVQTERDDVCLRVVGGRIVPRRGVVGARERF